MLNEREGDGTTAEKVEGRFLPCSNMAWQCPFCAVPEGHASNTSRGNQLSSREKFYTPIRHLTFGSLSCRQSFGHSRQRRACNFLASLLPLPCAPRALCQGRVLARLLWQPSLQAPLCQEICGRELYGFCIPVSDMKMLPVFMVFYFIVFLNSESRFPASCTTVLFSRRCRSYRPILGFGSQKPAFDWLAA